jgi:hypothetical protein
VQGVHIQQMNLETDEGGMGDHGDLLMCQKFLQLRRLHEQNQPLEQLDAMIEEIMGLMLKSTRDSQQGATEQKERSSSSSRMEQMGSYRYLFGI